jgi:hypothetical protein
MTITALQGPTPTVEKSRHSLSDSNPNLTPRVPDDRHANTAHPFRKLERIVEAARAVVRAVRRFFPVDDRPWEFADSPWARLISSVGPRLYDLEEMLNADRYPFANRGPTNDREK